MKAIVDFATWKDVRCLATKPRWVLCIFVGCPDIRIEKAQPYYGGASFAGENR